MSIGEKNENFDNYINNFEYCYACKNQIIFNESDIQKFLERYLYKKVNKKMIFMIYRLFPKIIHYINFDYFKKYKSYIFELNHPLHNIDSYPFIFQIYFHQDNLTEKSFIQCRICRENFCPLHLKLISLKTDLCKCNKHLQVCSYCCELFTIDYLCSIVHT